MFDIGNARLVELFEGTVGAVEFVTFVKGGARLVELLPRLVELYKIGGAVLLLNVGVPLPIEGNI